MGKDLAPIEKGYYDDCFYSTDLLDLILTHSLPIEARTEAKAYLVAREDSQGIINFQCFCQRKTEK